MFHTYDSTEKVILLNKESKRLERLICHLYSIIKVDDKCIPKKKYRRTEKSGWQM